VFGYRISTHQADPQTYWSETYMNDLGSKNSPIQKQNFNQKT